MYDAVWGPTLLITNWCLHNVSIHRKFYQNLLIKECARKFITEIINFSYELDVEKLSFL